MTEKLKNKIKSLFSQTNIEIDADLDILNKKSYSIFIKLKKEMDSIDKSIVSFKELNNIWKANIVFARMIFKYSLFAENFLLAKIVNMHTLDYKLFLSEIKKEIASLEKTIEPSKKIRAKISTLKKITEKKISTRTLFKRRFSEKISIYKATKSGFPTNKPFPASVNLDKIRTIRNKAVHSEFIIKYLINETEYSNFIDVYNLVDDEYKKQFKQEFQEIISKYNLKNNFDFVIL